MAFRIEISVPTSDFSDSYYFQNFPTKETLISAIERNKSIANEYWARDYDLCIGQIRASNRYPGCISPLLAMTSWPMEGCSISITQFQFCD